MSEKKALIISVSQYEDQMHLANLEFCENDGKSMYDVLSKQGYLIKQKLIGNVKYDSFKQAVFEFFRKDVNPTDTLLFYFTGHGFTDEYGDGFFCTTDIDIMSPDEKGYSFGELTKQMDKSDCKSIVSILDCCHSGGTLQANRWQAMGPEAKEAKAVKDGRASLEKEFRQGQGRCVLASSLSNKESYNLPGKPYSAFTYYLMEGLKPNKKTVDEKGFVTPENLAVYVSEELKKLQGVYYQKPIRHISLVDKLVLAEHPELSNVKSKVDNYDVIELKEKLKLESTKSTKYEKELERIKSKNNIFENAFNLLYDEKVEEFNRYRDSNPGTEIILENIGLEGKNLSGVNLSFAKMRGAKLNESNLEKAELIGIELQDAMLINANLHNSILGAAYLCNAILMKANISGADLSHADLQNAELLDADLSGADLSQSNLSGVNLHNTNLQNAILHNTNLSGSKISSVDFSNTYLTGADFTGVETFDCKGLPIKKNKKSRFFGRW